MTIDAVGISFPKNSRLCRRGATRRSVTKTTIGGRPHDRAPRAALANRLIGIPTAAFSRSRQGSRPWGNGVRGGHRTATCRTSSRVERQAGRWASPVQSGLCRSRRGTRLGRPIARSVIYAPVRRALFHYERPGITQRFVLGNHDLDLVAVLEAERVSPANGCSDLDTLSG